MAAQVHGDPSASKRVGGHCRGDGATDAAGRGPKPHGSDRVAAASCGALAGAGGIEPPNGGIKIRCLTTWLRPIRPFGNGGDTSVRGFPRVVPVYRERRGISTARRGKIPQARVAPRHASYERYASPFPMDAPPPS